MVLFISKDFTERNLELFFVNFFFEELIFITLLSDVI